MSRSPKPFFSIVTVTYNAERYLEATLKSIIAQDFQDYELIVVDGVSTDRTPNIIEQYRDHIDTLVVEKDEGIYDAMNKGIEQAQGTYVNFMNASDRFYTSQTLHEVHSAIVSKTSQAQAVDIAYGKVVNISSEKSGYQYEGGKPLSRQAFFSTTPMCHQTMFTQRTLFDRAQVGPYPAERGVGALYAWLGAYYTYRRSLDHILFIPQRLAYYLVGGYSFSMMKTISRERLITARKHFNLKYRLYNYVLFVTTQVKAELLMWMKRYNLVDRYRRAKYGLLQRDA